MPIYQDILLSADPHKVFKTLTSSDDFGAMTGQPADMDVNAGGAFTCFNGQISGRFIELTPGKQIVQAWRPGNWDAGVHSIVRIDLAPDKARTRLTLFHDAYPPEFEPHLEAGWDKMYWDPLKAFLTSS